MLLQFFHTVHIIPSSEMLYLSLNVGSWTCFCSLLFSLITLTLTLLYLFCPFALVFLYYTLHYTSIIVNIREKYRPCIVHNAELCRRLFALVSERVCFTPAVGFRLTVNVNYSHPDLFHSLITHSLSVPPISPPLFWQSALQLLLPPSPYCLTCIPLIPTCFL